MSIELIYDADCPNAGIAREQLLKAFAAAGLAPRWLEWDRAASDSPSYVRRYGSPTILVNGRDVADGGQHEGAGACRIYRDANGATMPVPPVEPIVAALKGDTAGGNPIDTPRSAWTNSTAALPAVGFALLPKLTCAACWPAYAGLLSALGLGFFDYTPYLLPLTAVFVAATLFALGFRARNRRGYAPLALGAIGATVILAGKFWLDLDVALYGGVGVLVGASLWNAWPRTATAAACAACAPDSADSQPSLTKGGLT